MGGLLAQTNGASHLQKAREHLHFLPVVTRPQPSFACQQCPQEFQGCHHGSLSQAGFGEPPVHDPSGKQKEPRAALLAPVPASCPKDSPKGARVTARGIIGGQENMSYWEALGVI